MAPKPIVSPPADVSGDATPVPDAGFADVHRQILEQDLLPRISITARVTTLMKLLDWNFDLEKYPFFEMLPVADQAPQRFRSYGPGHLREFGQVACVHRLA